MYSVQVVFFPYFRKCALSKLFVESCAGRAINEVKAKNVLPFGQHSHKRTQTRYFLQNTAKDVRKLQWLVLHTYVLSVPRDSSEGSQLTRQTSRLKSR